MFKNCRTLCRILVKYLEHIWFVSLEGYYYKELPLVTGDSLLNSKGKTLHIFCNVSDGDGAW